MPRPDTLSKADITGKENVKRNKARKPTNFLQAGILSYLKGYNVTLQDSSHFIHQSPLNIPISDLPKKYTHYAPFLLLPSTFARSSTNDSWTQLYTNLTSSQKHELFMSISQSFQTHGQPVTHIAVNAPIPPSSSTSEQEAENIMRSPSHLQPVFGDFGPSRINSEDGPTNKDFENTFWVTSTLPPLEPGQASIKQCWAPRWTMFSRGNLSEKNRILRTTGTEQRPVFPGLGAEDDLRMIDVVDFYVGIGYFGLCYLRRGVKRIWGWDLNPWSIEGLRRGCEINGWKCEVVKVDIDGRMEDGAKDRVVQRILESDGQERAQNYVRCVAFLGDNKWAEPVMDDFRRDLAQLNGMEARVSIRHANLGLLPTSQASWEGAVKALDGDHGGWLHVHENVDVRDIHSKDSSVVRSMKDLAETYRKGQWAVECVYVEQVKTYAPGVMHCVFDIQISPKR